MALIKCPECGKEISDKATMCIHCGFPLEIKKLQGKLIIKAQRIPDAIGRHVYFLYNNDAFFDEVLPGEVKSYTVEEPLHLVVGHKRGSFLGGGMPDSKCIKVMPNRETRLEASITKGLFMSQYVLSEVDVIDSE